MPPGGGFGGGEVSLPPPPPPQPHKAASAKASRPATVQRIAEPPPRPVTRAPCCHCGDWNTKPVYERLSSRDLLKRFEDRGWTAAPTGRGLTARARSGEWLRCRHRSATCCSPSSRSSPAA